MQPNVWKKSTRSGPYTDNCVEVMVWKTSTKSGPGGQCVEVAGAEDGDVLVRHSKNPDGEILRFTPGEWTAFVEGVKEGQFDL